MTREEAKRGDLISRQAVLDLIEHYNSDGLGALFYGYEEGVKFANAVNKLPSVKQEQKTGHWIEEDMFDGDMAYRCSECNELFWLESGTPKDNEYNFCPKCGADMRADKESEE